MNNRTISETASGFIQTYSGIDFHPQAPVTSEICIEDIAHALSCMPRFNGHTRKFYSVAQHSVLVSQRVPEADALWGLLHDASEAYLMDIPSPVKKMGGMDNYMENEKLIMNCILRKYQLQPEMPAALEEADAKMLVTEWQQLMKPDRSAWIPSGTPYDIRIDPWLPETAEKLFLQRWMGIMLDMNHPTYQKADAKYKKVGRI